MASAATAGAGDGATAAVAPGTLPHARRLPAPPPADLLSLLRRGGRTTHAAHAVWAAVLGSRQGAFAVDATAGRGGDTVALARLCGPAGRVLALDAQADAVEAAVAAVRAAVDEAAATGQQLAPVDVRLACHSTLGDILRAPVPPGGAPPWPPPAVVAFNLGFLPGAAHTGVTTAPATTLAALAAAVDAMAPGGAITVASYVGHDGGAEEADAVEGALGGLDPADWIVAATRLLNRPAAPRLAVAWRKG
jgi:hypothetical protein